MVRLTVVGIDTYIWVNPVHILYYFNAPDNDDGAHTVVNVFDGSGKTTYRVREYPADLEWAVKHARQ